MKSSCELAYTTLPTGSKCWQARPRRHLLLGNSTGVSLRSPCASEPTRRHYGCGSGTAGRVGSSIACESSAASPRSIFAVEARVTISRDGKRGNRGTSGVPPAHERASLASPRVTVAIPLHRSLRFVGNIVRNVRALSYGNVEIIISDRHCADRALDELYALFHADRRFTFIRPPMGSIGSATTTTSWRSHPGSIFSGCRTTTLMPRAT